VSFDMSLLKVSDYDQLAEIAEAGTGVLAGAVSPLGQQPDARGAASGEKSAADGRRETEERVRRTPTDTAKSIRELWRRMSQPPERCAEQVVVTPACGLAGASPDRARAALRWCREAAAILPEMMGS
jgi:hypothetical protein